MTFDLGSRSQIFAPNESPYIISYNSTMEKSLSITVLRYLTIKLHMTFELCSRSNDVAPNVSPYIISYISTIQVKYLCFIVFEIFDNKAYMTFDLVKVRMSCH